MNIRKIEAQELLAALHLASEVFGEDVAPTYTEEGAAQFYDFISYTSFLEKFENKEVTLFGAYEGVQICGMIALTNSGHICLFFVRKAFQRHGLGKALYQTAIAYVQRELHVAKITVNATPQSVEIYEHLGFGKVAEEQEQDGIRYVPMEAHFVQSAYTQSAKSYGGENKESAGAYTYSYGAGNSQTENNENQGMYSDQLNNPRKASAGPVIAGILIAILIAVLAVGGLFVFGKFIFHKAVQDVGITNEFPFDEDDSDEWYDEGEPDEDDNAPEDNGESEAENPTDQSSVSGIDQIEAYKAKNLSYEMKNKTYSFQDSSKTSTIIDFNVAYPQIKGHKNADQINKTIKNCAMSTVNEIYKHPSEEIKEKVLKASKPALISYVKCKVTYATDDFISIVFEDASARGEYNAYQADLRTLNIRLTDGKVYEVKDIVKLDHSFVNDWAKRMQKETDDKEILSELSKEQMKHALEGKDKKGAYEPNFFVDKKGIEIGFNFQNADSGNEKSKYVWVTAPYRFDEIKSSIKDSTFWNELKR